MGDDDPIARMRAENDQVKEAGREYAGTVWAFYVGLKNEGFTDEQAFRLTRDFLVGQVRNVIGGDE